MIHKNELSYNPNSKTKFKKGLRSTAAALAMVAGLTANAPHASAGKPETTHSAIDILFTSQCPQGFNLEEQYTGTQTVRRFENGRQQTQLHINSEFTNSVSGESFESTNAFMYTFTPEGLSLVGLTVRLNKPGEGVVSIESGRTIFSNQTGETMFDSGPNKDPLNLCEFMAD